MIRREKLLDQLFLATFVALCGFAIWAASIGWDHWLLDKHPLRQTRTAMNTLSMLQGGPRFSYEAWIFGPPWNLPFEFPLYQWFVAAFQRQTGLPLDQSGRWASELFFWLSLAPAWKILGHLSVPPLRRCIFLSLIVASPLYLFWSRTFMIESAALFLGLAYLEAVLRASQSGRGLWIAYATLLGILAASVKITTFFGFACAAIALSRLWSRPPGALLVQLVAFLGIPILLAGIWTLYADGQRVQNPLAEPFLSTSVLGVWSHGSLAARFSPEIWGVIFQRNLVEIAGSSALVLVSALSLLWNQRRRVAGLCSFALFLLVILAFPALHHVHDYYAYANGVFLLSGIGFAIVGLLEGGSISRWLGTTLFALTLIAQLSVYSSQFLHIQKRESDHLKDLIVAIQQHTRPHDVLLIYGQDWSPALAYTAGRRAVMDRRDRDLSDPRVAAVLEALALENRSIGGLVACNPSHGDSASLRASALNLEPTAVFLGGTCSLYARRR